MDRGRFSERLFRGVCPFINRSDIIIRHVRYVGNSTMDRRIGRREEVLLISLGPAGIFAGVDMNIAKSRKNQAPSYVDIAAAFSRADIFNKPALRIDFNGAIKLGVVVDDPAL